MATSRTLQIDACDAITGWSGIRDAVTPLTVDTATFQEGTASLNFGVTRSLSSSEWAEYYKAYSNDLSTYDAIQFYLYIASSSVLSNLEQIFIDVVCDAAYDNYYNWRIQPGDLSTGWNTITKYFNQTTATFGSPDRSAFQQLTVHIYPVSSDITMGDIKIDDIRATQTIDNQYDITLDSQGYVIKEGSYTRKDLPYLIDRFSSGDLEFSDFNFYQFKGQTDWSGGYNKKFLSADEPNVFYDGDYLDISKAGELRMAPKFSYITGVTNSGVINSITTYKGSAFFGIHGPTDSYVYSWIGSGNTLTNQVTLAGSPVFDMVVYNETLYVSTSSGATVRSFDGTTWSSTAQNAQFFEVLEDTLYASYGETMYSFNGTTWSTEFTHTGWHIRRMKAWRGKLYYLANDSGTGFDNSTKSALFYYDGVDRVELQTFTEPSKCTIEEYDNALHFVIGGIAYAYDGEEVSEELDLLDRYNKYGLDTYPLSETSVGLVRQAGRGIVTTNNKLFMTLNDSTSTSKILANPGEGWAPWYGAHSALVTAMGIFTRPGSSNDVLLVGDNNANAYIFDQDAYNTGKTTVVESAWIDMDLFNVDKLFRSLGFYCEPLPSSSLVVMYYKIDSDSTWTTFTRSNVANEVFVENQFPSTTKGKKIKYKIEISNTGGTQTPVVTDVVIKYVIAPDTKRQWTMGIVLTDGLLRNDQSRETKRASELYHTIWNSRQKKQTLTFTDVDGSQYNVLFNNLEVQGPFINKGYPALRGGEGPEYHAFIQLIEA